MNARIELNRIGLFRGVPSDALLALARRCTEIKLDSGQIVLHHYEESSQLFFVLEGRLRVIVYSAAGREVVFRDLSSGDVFGELSAIDDSPRSANVVALAPTRLAVMSKTAFNQAIREFPALAEATLRHLSRLVRSYSERIVELSTLGVEERVRMELRRLAFSHAAGENRVVIDPAPTLADVANRIGTTREAVSREIARLSRRALLQRQGTKLIVPDLVKLTEAANDDVM